MESAPIPKIPDDTRQNAAMMRTKMIVRPTLFPALLSCLLVAACASGKEKDALLADTDQPVEVLYNQALDASEAGDLVKAAERFEDVERLYPYSPWATQAQLLYAFTLYEDMRYEEAVVAIDRFIELHPGHPQIAYAYYLKGLMYYEQISDIGRDQEMTEKALAALRDVTRRFPQSVYARDAALKIDLTLDHLAGKEMEIGRFYLKRKNYLAAINRFRAVVDQYQTTSHTAEALHRLTEAYLALGLADEARRNAAVLGYNYPGSTWYTSSFKLLQKYGVTPADPATGKS
jgi:outer membrane protein assembly factor BamD